MIVELKWDKSVRGAIEQIRQKEYFESLKEYQGNMLLVGINYNIRTKDHECVIEELNRKTNEKTDDQQNHILHYRIVDPCDGTDIKYEGRTGSISDHFGVLQYFTDHGDEFRKYNDGALLRFVVVELDPAFYQGQKKRKDGRGSNWSMRTG